MKIYRFCLCFIILLALSCSDSKSDSGDEPGPPPVSNAKYVHHNVNIGDVHPVFFNNELYMYYLKTGGTFQSALLKSKDLVSYSDMNLNTDPAARFYSVLYVFKKPDTDEYVTYHSTDGLIPNGVLRGSLSKDLLNWKQLNDDYTVNEPEKKYYTLKDPYVYWNEDTQTYWAVRSGQEVKEGPWEFLYFTSPNLKNWKDCGTLYKTADVYGPIECPQMFKMGDYWYLLYSEYINNRVGKPQYFYSSKPEGPWIKPEADNCLDGSDNCAAQVVEVDGKWLLYGWIPSADVETIGYMEWGGTLTLPHLLVQNPDGTLTTQLEPSASSLVRGDRYYELPNTLNISSPGEAPVYEIISDKNRRFDIAVDFSMESFPQSFGIALQTGSGDETKETRIEFKGQNLSVKTGEIEHSSLYVPLTSGSHTLRIISDKDVVECFVDDKYALSALVSRDIDDATIKAYVTGGSVSFPKMEIFGLNNLNAKKITSD